MRAAARQGRFLTRRIIHFTRPTPPQNGPDAGAGRVDYKGRGDLTARAEDPRRTASAPAKGSAGLLDGAQLRADQREPPPAACLFGDVPGIRPRQRRPVKIHGGHARGPRQAKRAPRRSSGRMAAHAPPRLLDGRRPRRSGPDPDNREGGEAQKVLRRAAVVALPLCLGKIPHGVFKSKWPRVGI